MSSCGRVTSVCAEPSQCVHRSESPGSAGDSPVGTAPGQGLPSHPAGGVGELDLDPAKPLETKGLDSWPLESPPCVPPLCQLGASRVLIRCPRMGKGGPRGAGHPAQVTVSLCLPAPPCWCGTPWDRPAEGREIWSPHAGCWEGMVSSARGDAVAMSNSILAAGSHIPAHGPLAGDTPTLRAARGVPTRNVAACGLGLLPAVMGAVSCWLPSPRSPPGQGYPRAILSAGIRLFPKETFPWPCCSSS